MQVTLKVDTSWYVLAVEFRQDSVWNTFNHQSLLTQVSHCRVIYLLDCLIQIDRGIPLVHKFI